MVIGEEEVINRTKLPYFKITVLRREKYYGIKQNFIYIILF